MQRRFLVAVPLFLGVVTPLNAQPVSWGMAQCSALMGVMKTHVVQEPHKAYLASAEASLFDAAKRQAIAEGRDTGELGAVHARSADSWRAMGYSMAFKTEFRDWTDYCKSLARSYDVALDKSRLP